MVLLITEFSDYGGFLFSDIREARSNARRGTASSGYSARSVSPRSDPRPAMNHNRASSELSVSVTKAQNASDAAKGHRGRTFRSKSASNTLVVSSRTLSHSTPTSPLSNTVRAYTRDFKPNFGKDQQPLEDDNYSYVDVEGSNQSNMPGNLQRSKSASSASPEVQREK